MIFWRHNRGKVSDVVKRRAALNRAIFPFKAARRKSVIKSGITEREGPEKKQEIPRKTYKSAA